MSFPIPNIQPLDLLGKTENVMNAETAKRMAATKEAGQKFESIFLYQVVELMHTGLDEDPAFGGGHGEQMFRQVMNEQVADAIAKRGGLGLAEHVSRHLLKLQEG